MKPLPKKMQDEYDAMGLPLVISLDPDISERPTIMDEFGWCISDKCEECGNEGSFERLVEYSNQHHRLIADNERLREFVKKVSEQKPEKHDYWCACGQCDRNIAEAEDLLEETK